MVDLNLDKNYWENQYLTNNIGWDIGYVSTPLKHIIDSIENNNSSILIPGAGNAYEATYLLEQGFTNITIVDISPFVINKLKIQFFNNSNIKIIESDFFELQGQYDLILEQTFFCALSPTLRPLYVEKMFQLLNSGGVLTGVLFNRSFEKNPPFGGNIEEYKKLFENHFEIIDLEECKNSILPRVNSEVVFCLKKK